MIEYFGWRSVSIYFQTTALETNQANLLNSRLREHRIRTAIQLAAGEGYAIGNPHGHDPRDETSQHSDVREHASDADVLLKAASNIFVFFGGQVASLDFVWHVWRWVV